MLNEDCYRLLGIPPDADDKTIRKAYRDRSKELHPDVNTSPDAAQQFAKLAAAFAVLSDPIQRLKHDDHFGHNKQSRNQDANAKQRFSDFQKNKAAGLVNEWSTDYEKAMYMREQQRNAVIRKHKGRMKRLLAFALLLVAISIALLFIFATDLIPLP